MKLTYFIYLQLTIRRLIKHFTVIYGDANKQLLTLNLIFFWREKIYLGPQSPYQKLQISLFEPKKISHVCSEAIRGLKLKLCRNAHNISLYKSCVFYCRCSCVSIAMTKLPLTYNGKSESRPLLLSHCRCFDKSFTEMFLPNIWILSKPLNLR